MAKHENPEFFYIGESKDVTVSITFIGDEKSSERLNLLNAAEALKFFADNNVHKSWAKRIEVKS
jgi:hypothetical protein